ncbi:hypothetical protein [uncultured Fretibacterium sp.]|nr:hypothetical protein [uncultured Fretibacterium sp.]
MDFILTDEEAAYPEAPCRPQPFASVMAQNKPRDAGKKQVWSTGDQKING